MLPKILKTGVIVAFWVFVAMQLFRPQRNNPPSDPADSFEAIGQPSVQLGINLKRACYDCHSNQTNWPWYSHVAPVSWLIATDVREGRARLNFSEWTRPGAEGGLPSLGEVCESVATGKMPLRSYTLMHPDAKLAAAEISKLCPVAGRENEPSESD